MRIGVLGTGMVGRAHAERLLELGHDVYMGTRDVERTMSAQPPASYLPPMSEWLPEHSAVNLMRFADAARSGEIVINCIDGQACLGVLQNLTNELDGKVIIDIANPLDSSGSVTVLSVANTDSLAEQIQRALPGAKVVKTLNTVSAGLQTHPEALANGDHHAFISADDESAKAHVVSILKDWYGWKNVIDIGDLTSARAAEAYLLLWLRLWGSLQTPLFNIQVLKQS